MPLASALPPPQRAERSHPAGVSRLQGVQAAEKRGARLREEPRLASPLPRFLHTGGRRPVIHGKGSSVHKKTPTRNGQGQPTLAAAPFPRKDVSAPCRAGLLARGMTLLSAPSQGQRPQWSLQISFRSQLRGSDGFAPSSLVTVWNCEATWLCSTRQLLRYPSVTSTPCQTDAVRFGDGTQWWCPPASSPLTRTTAVQRGRSMNTVTPISMYFWRSSWL